MRRARLGGRQTQALGNQGVQVLAALLLTLCACAPAEEGPSGDAAATDSTPTAAANAAPAVESLTSPGGQATPEQLSVTWWVLIPDRPQRCFRATLVPTEHEQHFGGSWVSFDWRGTTRPETLHRVTKPVEIQAEYSDKRLFVRGPAPQIDAESGLPTGAQGNWELRLRLASLPGEQLRFSGKLLSSTDEPDDEGVAVDVTQAFVPWGG